MADEFRVYDGTSTLNLPVGEFGAEEIAKEYPGLVDKSCIYRITDGTVREVRLVTEVAAEYGIDEKDPQKVCDAVNATLVEVPDIDPQTAAQRQLDALLGR